MQTASNDSATASKAETQEGEEEDGYELSQRDVGKTLKVDCGEDGMIPVVLLEHRRRQRFLVRFKSDNKQMEVDLGGIQWQFQSKGRAVFLAKIWSLHTGFITSTLGIPTDLCEWLCVLRLSIN